MNPKNLNCPNSKCISHSLVSEKRPKKSLFVRNGFDFRKDDSRKIQTYRCLGCGKSISDATNHPAFRQRKRRINPLIEKLFVSGVSQRRAAIILGINRKTVVRKFRYLANQARLQHKAWQEELGSDGARLLEIQFDDLETSEHSKCKPLSVALSVEKKTRKILSIHVSQMSPKGTLVHKARKLYGKRKDKRSEGWNQMMRELTPLVSPFSKITSDQNPKYAPLIQKYFPHSTYIQVKGRRGCITGQGELKVGGFDPLFSLNHTCAMLRANLNRLFRKTWCTTKNIQGLRDHLAIYVKFHNEVLTTELNAQTQPS
jgi:hypothetical protein